MSWKREDVREAVDAFATLIERLGVCVVASVKDTSAAMASVDHVFTKDPGLAEQPPEDNVAWEPMEEYGETESDRLYFREGYGRSLEARKNGGGRDDKMMG